MESATDLAALLTDHKPICVDMRSLARSMGNIRFQQEIEERVTAAQTTSDRAVLRNSTSSPLSPFDPAAWVACFVWLFYGDCVQIWTVLRKYV